MRMPAPRGEDASVKWRQPKLARPMPFPPNDTAKRPEVRGAKDEGYRDFLGARTVSSTGASAMARNNSLA